MTHSGHRSGAGASGHSVEALSTSGADESLIETLPAVGPAILVANDFLANALQLTLVEPPC